MSKSVAIVVAIVTGASQGIGRATAIRLARHSSAPVPVAPGARWMTGSTLRTDGGEAKSI